MYRMSGKIRAGALIVLIVLNGATLFAADRLDYDEDFNRQWQLATMPMRVADLVLGILIWKGNFSITALHRMTIACLLVESAMTLLGIWAFGTVGSQMVVFGYALVLVYRATFGFEAGTLAFGLMLVGHWGIALAEITGYLPAQPMFAAGPAPHFATANAHAGAMMVQSVSLVVIYMVSNWMVARLRHKERTIRFLRESLAASEQGKVGRHTGRTLCDTYVVGSLIGVGGMGEVYRGHHRRTRRALALKLLHPHLVDDNTLLARFRREAEVTGRLGNAHIVEIVDVDRDEDTPFMALELLDGEHLGDRLGREGQLPLAEVVDIIGQLADGLTVAHRAGIVHRDLKPENIFVCRGPRLHVKILDFGISKIRSDATAITQDATLLGTPDFMSPEQARGEIDAIDARSDVFALAGIAYTAVTGRRPFAASSVPALLRRICDEEPVPPERLRPDLPAAVSAVLAIGLAKRAAERFADAAGFAAAFAAAAAGSLEPALVRRAESLHRGAVASITESPAVSTADTDHAV
jgi:serine/threonine-protein kinase